ncbi:glycosyl hydrolase [Chitinophaga lutea]
MFRKALGILLLAAFATAGRAQAQQQRFEEIVSRFRDPGADFRTAPLWVWNSKVNKRDIDSMLHDFRGNDFGGVIIHPRPGLITEYLSTEWYDLFLYAMEQGKKLGLNIWIYDENSYPTGFAGGLLADEMPEAYNQGQMLYMEDTTKLPDDLSPYFLILKDANGYTDITSTAAAEQGKTGSYRLFRKVNYQKSNRGSVAGPIGVSYVDLMAKGVTEKFIDVTYKGYEKVAGREFGKAIKGVFSDEPTILNEGRHCVRWTPDLFDRFRERWGYDLRLHLPSLFGETGDWKRVRHNYFVTLLQLFVDRWSKPVFAYMEARGLVWTGHYWEHGWPSPYHGPDNMAMYAWHQMPGIDMLFNQFNEDNPVQFGNIRAVKELASVANQLGKKRTLSETYGGGGWEVTFKDMKRLADWQYVLGVNFMNQHLSFVTVTGARKYDYPPSFSYHEPWWPHYKELNRYFSRMQYLVSRGEAHNDILIIEPTTSAWMYYARDGENKRFFDIGKRFHAFVTQVQRAYLEYDLGSENIIKDHGRVEGKKFVIGKRGYRVVVIPPGMENIDGPTFRLLQRFVAAGGQVVSFEALQFVDGAPSKELDALRLQVTGDIAQLHNQGFTITGDNIGGKLYHHRRSVADGELLLLTNASLTDASAARITMNGGDVQELDIQRGDVARYAHTAQGKAVVFDVQVPPAGSLMLFVATKKMNGYKTVPAPKKWTPVEAAPMVVNRPAFNTLTIDFCDLRLYQPDTAYTQLHAGVASNTAFRHFGFTDGAGNPWNNRTQYKTAIVSRDTFSRGTGYTATYHIRIAAGVDTRGYKAVIEQPALWKEVKINGTTVRPKPGEWWLDRSFGVFEIGPYLRAGDNELSINVSPMSVFAEIEPVYILGDFNLEAVQKGWQIVPPQPLQAGPWNKQGLPLYGQQVTYSKTFTAAGPAKSYAVELGDWKGTVAAVTVNGQYAGVIYAAPNRLDISKLVKQGQNKIEISVTGSLKNVLGPFYNKPAPGLVDPWKWYNIKTQPAGEAYDLYAYGLMEDYRIVAGY